MFIPHEFTIGEIFMPPLLIAAILGTIAASVTARQLNRYRWSKHFFFPPLVMLAMMVIYTVLFGLTIIPF